MTLPVEEREQYVNGLRAEKSRIEAEIARLHSGQAPREKHDVILDDEARKVQDMLGEMQNDLEDVMASLDAAYTSTGFDRPE